MNEWPGPTLTRSDDGTITMDWPDDAPSWCRVDRAVLESIVVQLNELNDIKRHQLMEFNEANP